MFNGVFKDKKVLVTGHTGFKGSWLCEWLLRLGSEVVGLSLPADDSNIFFNQLQLGTRITKTFEADIRDPVAVGSIVGDVKPDFIFHLAAQPLVRRSYHIPIETFDTNVLGTVNLLEALRGLSNLCSAILVTTDKCYENREWIHAYRENDPLGGHDPYSASKACAEIASHCYRKSYFCGSHNVRIATARAGNVIGGGDWAEDRIFPDIARSLRENQIIKVRNRHATRPWQHVLEPLAGYLWLAACLRNANDDAVTTLDSFNFGPNLSSNRSVENLVREVLKHYSGAWDDCTQENQPHEANLLNLNIEKSHHLLHWHPVWDFEQAVKKTADWYVADASGQNIPNHTANDIASYCDEAKRKSLQWTIEHSA